MSVYVTSAAMEIPEPSESNFECSSLIHENDPDSIFPQKSNRENTIKTAIGEIFDNSWNKISHDLGKVNLIKLIK